MKRLAGRAQEAIRQGDLVLCRDFRVSRAPKEIANAVAARSCEAGDYAEVRPIEGLGERDLHAMANGPIMEPLRIYLPAGKVSEAEYQHRLALDYERAGIDRPSETRHPR